MAKMLTNKTTGKKFPLGFKRKGSAPSISSNKNLLTIDDLNKKAQERQIRIKDLATDEEIEKGESRVVSLNPEHEDLDLVFLRKDSPIKLSQKVFESNPELAKQELKEIRESEE